MDNKIVDCLEYKKHDLKKIIDNCIIYKINF